MNAHITSPAPVRSRLTTLAVAFTAATALVAWFLAAVAELPEQAVVITVMVLAFVTSWIVTNRADSAPAQHRVTMIPLRARAR